MDLMEEWTMEAVKAQEGKVISCKSVTIERHTFGRVLTRRDTWHGDSRSRWMTKGVDQLCSNSRCAPLHDTSGKPHRNRCTDVVSTNCRVGVGNGNRGDGNGSVPPNSHEANGKDEPRGCVASQISSTCG